MNWMEVDVFHGSSLSRLDSLTPSTLFVGDAVLRLSPDRTYASKKFAR